MIRWQEHSLKLIHNWLNLRSVNQPAIMEELLAENMELVSGELPFDVLLRMALQSLDTWRLLVRSVPEIGRWSLTHQSLIKKHFTLRRENNRKREYRLNGRLHREEGPAIEHAKIEGEALSVEWYVHGRRHRKDGPAFETKSGAKLWYRNGRLHRENGPALETRGGIKAWYFNGELHREDGPAVEIPRRCKAGEMVLFRMPDLKSYVVNDTHYVKLWFKHGILHRRNGPLPTLETSWDQTFFLRTGLSHVKPCWTNVILGESVKTLRA